KVEGISGSKDILLTFDEYVKVDTITAESIAVYAATDPEALDVIIEAVEPVMGKGNKMLTLQVRVILVDTLQFGDQYRIVVQGPLTSYADQMVSEVYDVNLTVAGPDIDGPVITIVGDATVN